MKLLGISAFFHDSGAAILDNGKIVAAAQEERFTRVKHDASFPTQAIQYCLNAAKSHINDIDYVVFYEKPFLKYERLLETYLAFAPRGCSSFIKAISTWTKEKIFQKKLMIDNLRELGANKNVRNKFLFAEHHQSHAASAFFPSPFTNALILTLDGVGEWATTSVHIGTENKLSLVKELHFPHSLGLLYSAFTYFIGFKVNSGEYKLMGLAPYGSPKYYSVIMDNLLDLKEDGTFRLNMHYFDYCTGNTMTSPAFNKLFEDVPREPESPLLQKHMDLAASIQAVVEEIIIKMIKRLRIEYGLENLCLAGGVALNCVANGRIVREKIFDNIWVQPAAGDSGGALGAALAAHHCHLKLPRHKNIMHGSYLGPQYAEDLIKQELDSLGAKYAKYEQRAICMRTAQLLYANKVVGWFQGRMEYGPRALGARSILANPCDPDMQKKLNLKIKYRESFRPFAPAVLAEHLDKWFDLDTVSPYMLMVAFVQMEHRIKADDQTDRFIDRLNIPRSKIPAVTHVDNSARIQTVHKETNPVFHALISEFHKLSGCPILINTSFNIRSEPIVCTPRDAFKCFMGTEMDVLVIGNYILLKEEQNVAQSKDYRAEFALD